MSNINTQLVEKPNMHGKYFPKYILKLLLVYNVEIEKKHCINLRIVITKTKQKRFN